MSEPANKGVPAIYRSPWLWAIAAVVVLLIVLQSIRDRPSPSLDATPPTVERSDEG